MLKKQGISSVYDVFCCFSSLFSVNVFLVFHVVVYLIGVAFSLQRVEFLFCMVEFTLLF